MRTPVELKVKGLPRGEQNLMFRGKNMKSSTSNRVIMLVIHIYIALRDPDIDSRLVIFGQFSRYAMVYVECYARSVH